VILLQLKFNGLSSIDSLNLMYLYEAFFIICDAFWPLQCVHVMASTIFQRIKTLT